MNLGADVTRIWDYRSPPGAEEVLGTALDPLRIVLRHNPVTQTIHITAGKKEIEMGETQFKLGRNVLGRVKVESGMSGFLQRFSKYRYTCTVEDDTGEHVLKESLDLVKNIEAGSLENVNVRIPEMVVDGSKTVWYKIEATITQAAFGEKRTLRFECHRRFRDFRFAYKQLLSAYKNHHLVTSLPKHPKREVQLLTDHTEEQFLRDRQVRLEGWLRNTLQFPRAGANPDILALLGMGGDPNLREISIVIQPGESLGLKMKKRLGPLMPGTTDQYVPVFPQAAVLQVVSGPDGRPGIAAGKIFPGDVITRVAGDSVVRMGYERIISMLKAAPKPLVVHFLARINRNAPTESNDTSEASNAGALSSDYALNGASPLTGGDGDESEEDSIDASQSASVEKEDAEDLFLSKPGSPAPTESAKPAAAVAAQTAPAPATAAPLMFARSKPKVLSEYIAERKQDPTKGSNAEKKTKKIKEPAPPPATTTSAPSPVTAAPASAPQSAAAPSQTVDTMDSVAAVQDPVAASSPLEEQAPSADPPAAPPARPARSSISETAQPSTIVEPPSEAASFLERDINDSLQAPPVIPSRTADSSGVEEGASSVAGVEAKEQQQPIKHQQDMEYNDDDLEDVSF